MRILFGQLRITQWVCLMVCVIGGAWSSSPPPAQAGVGEQFDLEAHDLHLTVDSRWAGTALGGYYPVRIQVENQGADCQLTIRFTPYPEQQLPTVERRDLQIASGAKALVTLSIPMVGRGAVGYLEVEKDGELVEALKRQIALAHADYRSDRSSILIISEDNINSTALEHGIQFGRRMESRITLDLQVLKPRLLPGSWTDYTGLDTVMISQESLADLDADKRAAILHWAQTGGILVVYEVGQPANASEELKSLLNLADSSQWHPAPPRERLDPDAGNELPGETPHPGVGAILEERQPDNDGNAWEVSEDTFTYQTYLLGRVYAFPGNPFPGTRLDWSWWSGSVPPDLSRWEARMGVLPRRANENFFNFLIPGVTSVPIYAFLVLMTLFTIVIGPLNYILLRRRKRTYLLLLTIPAIAFVTSLTLFVYSTLAYGFDVASRSRSLTVLDQQTNTAVSLSRISLFAGIAPSEGLSFSPNTAVYPIWAPLQFGQSQFESGRIIWGEQQELKDGWLRSRTRTQFMTVQHRTERGRLEIESASPTKLTISNGTEWDIAGIIWVDDQGKLYRGGALGAGNTGELELVPEVPEDQFEDQLQPFHKLLQKNENLEVPDDIEEGKQSALGLMETKIQQFLKIKTQKNQRYLVLGSEFQPLPKIIPPRTFLAVLADRPGIELGLEDTDERAGYHLLLGYY